VTHLLSDRYAPGGCTRGSRKYHRLNWRTPSQTFGSRDEVGPIGEGIDATGYRMRHDWVDRSCRVTLRHKGKLHHIGMDNPLCRLAVVAAAPLTGRLSNLSTVQQRVLQLADQGNRSAMQ
jgi:hypothetical protein